MEDKELKRSYFRKGLTAFLVIAASIVFYFFMLRIEGLAKYASRVMHVLQPVIFGLVIAYLVNPIVNFLNGKLIPFLKNHMKDPERARKTGNSISVIVSVLFFCIILVGIVALVVPQFITSITNIITVLPGQIDALISKAEKLVRNDKRAEQAFVTALEYGKKWLQTDLSSFVNRLATSVATGILSVVNFVKNLGIGIIFAIYLLLSKRKFVNGTKKVFYALFREKAVTRIFEWLSKSHEVFSNFINGKLLDSFIMGIICFIGLTILGIPYPVLIASIIAVTNVIPVFGPWIGGIPTTALVLISDPVKGIYLAIFQIVLQTIEGNIIEPKILGNKIGLDTFWVVFAIVLGGGMFGIIGMLIGVPGFAVIYYIIAAIINYLLRRKGKSTDSADYANSNGDINKLNGGDGNA